MAKFININSVTKKWAIGAVVLLVSFTHLKKPCQQKNVMPMNRISNQCKNILLMKQTLKLNDYFVGFCHHCSACICMCITYPAEQN